MLRRPSYCTVLYFTNVPYTLTSLNAIHCTVQYSSVERYSSHSSYLPVRTGRRGKKIRYKPNTTEQNKSSSSSTLDYKKRELYHRHRIPILFSAVVKSSTGHFGLMIGPLAHWFLFLFPLFAFSVRFSQRCIGLRESGSESMR